MLPILSKIHDEGIYYPTIKEIRKWHGILNEAVFDGKVPKFQDIKIIKMRGQIAAAISDKHRIELQINPHFRNFKKFLIILAHEMVHAWEQKKYGKMTHGPTFFHWKEKLQEQGIPLFRKYDADYVDIPK